MTNFSRIPYWAPALVLLYCAVAAAQSVVYVDFENDSTQDCKPPWRMRYDHRQLLTMAHPWQPSEKGLYALVWKMVRLPEDWKAPITLHFYCSDDYCAGTAPQGGAHATGFVGHRMKQILIDNELVWSQDVADVITRGTGNHYQVVLKKIIPGKPFRLGVLTYDAHASSEVLEKDYYYDPKGRTREQDETASHFMTHVYWGDFAFAVGDAQPKPGRRPTEDKVRSVHNQRWPLPAFGDGWKADLVRLSVSAPAGIPKAGFPLQMGVPLPVGKVADTSSLSVYTEQKNRLYVQKTALDQWNDESLRWCLLDTVLKPGMDSLELRFSKDKAAPEKACKIAQSLEGIQLEANPLSCRFNTMPPVAEVSYKKETIFESIRMLLHVDGEEIPATTDSIQIQDKGPFRSTIVLKGRFDGLDHRAGAYTLYCSAYAGLPYLKLCLCLTNDTRAPLAVSAFQLLFDWKTPPQRMQLPGKEVQDGFVVRQPNAEQRLLCDTGIEAKTNFFLGWDKGAITVKRFCERFPKQVHWQGKQLILDLIGGQKEALVFTPGESISHEVWVALGAVDGPQFAATVAQPPILQHPEYFCASGAFGPAFPQTEVDKLQAHFATYWEGKSWKDLQQHYGLRHFPDAPFPGGEAHWCNNYYERMLGLWSAWLLSGERSWYDRAVDVCTHIMDTVVIHAEIPGHDWVGAMHGPGKNHVPGPWPPAQRSAGLALCQKLTGMPAMREAVLGVADYCIRSRSGVHAPSIRYSAAPFDAICTAYDETGEVAFLDEGKLRVEDILTAMDRRRGAWSEAHGSQTTLGNVPWMAAQLARPLYWWYRMTGDVEAAQALVGLAESILCENTDWDEPAVLSAYSYNPRYTNTPSYSLLILPLFFAAYELTEDAFFREAAEAQWRRWLESDECDSPLNTYWNTPWLLHYLHQYELLVPPATAEKN